MVKEYLNLEEWQELQKDMSTALGIKIKTIDLDGNAITNDDPFFCKVVQNTENGKLHCKQNYKYFLSKIIKENKSSMEIECDCGIHNIMLPIQIKNKVIGAIVAGYYKKNIKKIDTLSKKINIDKEDLLYEYNKLEEKKEFQEKILSVLAHKIPKILYKSNINSKKNSALSMLKEISNMLNSTLEIKQIMTEIIRFAVKNNFAQACSVVTLEPLRRYTSNESNIPKHYTAFETKIVNEIIRDRKIRGIANISKDKRFNSKSNFNLYDALVSIPITNKHQVVGALNIYSDSIETLKQNLELFSIIANQAGFAISNAKQYQNIKQSAITDKLTGLYNRRYFMDVLEQEIARSNRFGHPISVAMLDIDHFKHYNDRNGHPKGDKLLQELSEVIKSNVRDVDTVGRYGGEEFIIVFPEIKPSEILSVAERIVKSIANTNFDNAKHQPLGKVSISMGLLTCMDSSQDAKEIIKFADKALYQAKNDGRNQVRARVVLRKNMEPVDVN